MNRVIFILIATLGIASFADNFLDTDCLADKNFECSRKEASAIVKVGELRVCVLQTECKYMPKKDIPPTKLPKKDTNVVQTCRANEDNSTCPEPGECDERENGDKQKVGIGVGYLFDKDKKGEEDSDLYGKCKYSTRGGHPLYLTAHYGKDDVEIVCGTPITCTDGKEKTPYNVAACEPEEMRVVEQMNPKTKKMQKYSYPVCSGPVTCLNKSLPIEMAKDGKTSKLNGIGLRNHRAKPEITTALATRGTPTTKSIETRFSSEKPHT